MKKKFLFLFIFLCFICLAGCGKTNYSSIIKNLDKKIKKADSYRLTGTLEITNNDDTYQYDVDVSYKKDDNYRVSLVNKSNDHEQIILKNKEGVFVVTPSLNKSFKFQSDWPNNNSQIYLLNSIIKDIKNDEKIEFEEKDGKYIFTTKVQYPNNNQLVKQKIIIDKDLKIEKIEVMNADNVTQMIMNINTIDYGSEFNEDYFDLNSIVNDIDNEISNKNENTHNGIEEEQKNNEGEAVKDDEKDKTDKEKEENTNSASTIDDVIYPLYIPTGTTLSEQEKVTKTDGERIILTFEGEKPFLLVEENSTVSDEFSVIPTLGEPFFLTDTIAALTDNSLSWSSNGMDYYIVSDVMSQVELIEIASSITAIPTIK